MQLLNIQCDWIYLIITEHDLKHNNSLSNILLQLIHVLSLFFTNEKKRHKKMSSFNNNPN